MVFFDDASKKRLVYQTLFETITRKTKKKDKLSFSLRMNPSKGGGLAKVIRKFTGEKAAMPKILNSVGFYSFTVPEVINLCKLSKTCKPLTMHETVNYSALVEAVDKPLRKDINIILESPSPFIENKLQKATEKAEKDKKYAAALERLKKLTELKTALLVATNTDQVHQAITCNDKTCIFSSSTDDGGHLMDVAKKVSDYKKSRWDEKKNKYIEDETVMAENMAIKAAKMIHHLALSSYTTRDCARVFNDPTTVLSSNSSLKALLQANGMIVSTKALRVTQMILKEKLYEQCIKTLIEKEMHVTPGYIARHSEILRTLLKHIPEESDKLTYPAMYIKATHGHGAINAPDKLQGYNFPGVGKHVGVPACVYVGKAAGNIFKLGNRIKIGTTY